MALPKKISSCHNFSDILVSPGLKLEAVKLFCLYASWICFFFQFIIVPW